MGSFNVACSVSSLSIHPGDEIVFIPLEVSQYPYKIGDGNTLLIYPWCFYSPVTLPIFGEYGDYGLIDHIVAGKNVEVIEDFFGVPIDNVCNIMRNSSVGPISSGMYILAEIFWTLVKKCIGDDGKVALKRKDLVKEYERLKEALNPKVAYNLPGIGDPIYRLTLMDIVARNTMGFREYYTFQKIYHPVIKSGKMRKELIDFAMFDTSFFMCNRFYFPAQNGCQFGNVWMERVLSNKTAEIARGRKRW